VPTRACGSCGASGPDLRSRRAPPISSTGSARKTDPDDNQVIEPAAQPQHVTVRVPPEATLRDRLPGIGEALNQYKPQCEKLPLRAHFLLTAVDRRTPLHTGAYCTDIARRPGHNVTMAVSAGWPMIGPPHRLGLPDVSDPQAGEVAHRARGSPPRESTAPRRGFATRRAPNGQLPTGTSCDTDRDRRT
jgi:hypothetical protein